MRKLRWLIPVLIMCMIGIFAVSGALADLSVTQKEINVDFIDSRPGATVAEPEPVAEPAKVEVPAPVQNGDAKAVHLDLQWDSNGNSKGRYILLINGKALDWEQSIGSAVDFCAANGIPMERYEDGNGCSSIQEIVLAGNIRLINEYGFYVDQGAGQMTGKLHTVRMYTHLGNGLTDKEAREAQEVFDKLRAAYGEPTEGLRVYTGDAFLDTSFTDIPSAVKKLRSALQNDYGFISANFNNIHMYVTIGQDYSSTVLHLTCYN